MPVQTLLEGLPCFTGLKARAEDNNHQADSRSTVDKFLKQLQQRLLHSCRALAYLHGAGLGSIPEEHLETDPRIVSQQFFMFLYETEEMILKERKRRSSPGSVTEKENVLFKKEDLAIDKQNAAVNAAGMAPHHLERYYFQTFTGHKHNRWKGQGQGKSKGKSWGWSWGQGSSYGRGRGKPSKGKGKCPDSVFA